MSNRFDELMNKYLDGELKGKELQDFEEIIKAEENKKVFQAYSILDKSLRETPHSNLTLDFTSSIMLRINKNVKANTEQRRFFIMVVTVFTLLTLTVLGVLFSQVFSNAVSGGSDVVKESAQYMKSGVEYLKYLFPKKSISILGAFISFGLLLTGWFFIDFRKKKI